MFESVPLQVFGKQVLTLDYVLSGWRSLVVGNFENNVYCLFANGEVVLKYGPSRFLLRGPPLLHYRIFELNL